MLDAVAHRYGRRPSDLWGITGPESLMLGIAFDSEVLRKANEFERRQYEESRKGKSVLPEKERKRGSLATWISVRDSAPEGSAIREKAGRVVAQLMGEVDG